MKILSLLFLFLHLCLPVGAQTTSFIPLQSSWRYLDNGSNQDTLWRESGFDDAAWGQGAAELGYGDTDEVTTLGYGPSATAKYITTYFRKSFTVTGAASYTAAQLRVRRDDGVVVYLNGTEVFRSNMPTGTVTSATLATAAVSGTDEAALYSGSVNPLLLVDGTNVIAAEIHQNNGTSSDISFDLEFTGTIPAVVPAANAQTVSVTEDVPKAMTLTGSDPNGDPLSYAVVTPPVKGVLSGTPPALTYTPNLNVSGADSFTFTVSDGVNVSPPATVTVNIAAVNDVPVAEAGAQTVAEDGTVTFNLTGSDLESAPATLNYSIVTPPAHGTLSGLPPLVTYAPALDYHGPDSFTFRLFDGTDYSAPATVSLTVTPVDDAPTGAAVAASAEATEPTLIPLPVSDPDGDALTIQTTAPAHGTLSVTGTTATYTGEAAYTGPDAFTYTVSDGTLTAGPFTVSLTVVPFNTAPVAAGQSVSLDEDTAAAVTLAATDAENQPLTWTVVTPPAHGTLSGTAPELLFSPRANYHGADSFTFRVSDGQENSNTATVSLTISPVNDAPAAVAGTYSVEAGTPLALTLAGTDVDGDVVTLAIADQPAHGVLTGTPPNVTYTADISFTGTDTFTFTASDGTLTSPPATVTVNVAPFNQPPLAAAGSVTTAEDTPAALTLSATDAESAPLTYAITAAPAHGSLSGTAPALIYTPAANYSGADSFTWTANDGAKTSAPAVFSITVTPVNDAPAATALSISTRTDTPVAVTLSGTDTESNPLTFSIASPASHGTLSGTAPALTYTPAAGYTGPDSFTYRANDGALNSAPATVNITITAPVLARGPYVQMTATDRATVRWRTDVPALSVLHYGTEENALTGTASGAVLKTSHELQVTGLSPDTRYYYSVGNPVLAAGPTYYFTTHPPADTERPYRFWVLGDAGTGTATQAAVRDVFYTYNGAAKVDGVLLLGDNAYETGTDAEYQTRFFNIYPAKLRNTVFWPCFGNHDAGSASSGTQTGVYYSNFTMPKLAESGGVASGTAAYYSFDYGNIHFVCLDSEGSSRSGTGAMAQWLQADLSANWRDWTVAFWHHPPYSKGNHDSDIPTADSGRMKDMREIFVPILESFGVDLLLFGHEHAYFRSQFVDGHYGTSTTFNAATMLKQAGFGDPAVDGPYLKTSGAHTGAVFAVAGSSGKMDTFTRSMPVLALALNESGSVVLDVNGRQLTSRFLNSTGTVRDTFSILHNDPPALAAAAFTGPEDAPLAFSLAGTDADGDTLTYEIVTAPAVGSLTGTAPNLIYTPPANFHGSSSFEVRVNDGRVNSANATITLHITPENDAPTAQPAAGSGTEDTPLPISLTGADLDGDAISFSITTPPAHGTLTGTAPDLVYTPAADWHGSDTFSFTVSDGTLTSAPAEVTLTIAAVNDAPAAEAVVAETTEDTAVNLTLSGTDGDGDTLSYIITSLPAHGSLSGTLPALTYLPDPDWHGTDTFTYIATDGTADSAAAPVSITVTPVNDAPAALPQSLATTEDSPLPVSLAGTDAEASLLTYSITVPPAHGALSGTAPNFTYTPDANFAGSDEFRFTVNDGELTSVPAIIAITVTPVNDAPVAVSSSIVTPEDTAAAVVLSGTDTEGDPLTFAITAPPAHGTLSGTAPGLIYTPDADFNGSDSFEFTVSDGVEVSEPAAVTLTISAVNDLPQAEGQSISLEEDGTIALTLSGTDVESDPLTFAITTSPAHGTLTGTAPDLLYTPDANFHGSDSIAFAVNDGSGASLPAVVNLTITPVNDAPTSTAQFITTSEDTALPVVITGGDTEGDALAFTVTTQPLHGSLSGSPPNLAYTPDADWNGTDTFAFQADDGTAVSAQAIVTIEVTAVNDLPVAVAQTPATTEDTPLPLMLTASDVEGDALTYAVTVQPQHGTLTGTAPDLIYTPDADFHGADDLTFTASDATGAGLPATVSITVNSVNDPPVAATVTAETTEDTAVNLTLSGTDVDADALSYVVTSLPAHGSLSGTLPALTYLPDPDWNGTDSFTFIATDGTVDSAAAVVNITVSPVNDAPAALPQTLATAEDAPLPLTLTGTDAEGTPPTYAITVPPAHGVLSGTPPNLTYTPVANFSGSDEFQYTVNDGELTSEPATISLTVTAVNDAPLAIAASATTPEDTAAAVVLLGTDTEGETLSFTITTPPAHGTLSGTAPELTYTPDADFYGIDSFEFSVSDGPAVSGPAAVTLTISAANDSPLASGQTLSLPEDGNIALTLSGTDVENDSLTFAITTPPAHGTLTGTAPELLYTPDANFHGADSIAFTVNDGSGASLPAVIALTITSVNDAPAAMAQSVSISEDTALPVVITGEDTEGDVLTFAISTPPLHGSLSGTPPNLIYTPAPDWNGTDSFGFTAADGVANSAEAIVSVEVAAVNDLPVAVAQTPAATEDTPLALMLTATDVEGDALTFAITMTPQHGTLTGTAPDLTYTPDADFHGTDSFAFTGADATGPSLPATVSITVNSVNDAPLADAMTVETTEDSAVNLTLTGTDVDGDTLSFAVTSPPAHGTLSGTPPALTYLPDTDWHGTDSFSYTATDGSAESAAAVVHITVSPVNDTPAALAQALTTAEDAALPITLSATDVEGDALSFSVTSPPQHGTLTGTAPDLIYTPDTNYHGSDSFAFTASDADAPSTPSVISLDISPVNDAPVGTPQALTTAEDAALPLTLVAVDADGDSLAYTISAAPAHGTLSGVAPDLIYTPYPNYHGADMFSFIASDAATASEPAVISIEVSPVNDPPAAAAQSLTGAEDVSFAITLTAVDPENDPLTYTLTTSPAHGTLTGTAPDLTYMPDANWYGSDSFSFTVSDGVLTSAPAVITLSIAPANDAPQAAAVTVETTEDTAVNVTLSGTDVDGDTLSYVVTSLPAHGSLSGTLPVLTYLPDPDWHGVDSFSYIVSDGTADSAPAVISITVTPVNDPPAALSQALATAEDSPLTVELTGADAEESSLNFAVTVAPLHGTISGTAPNFTYTPAADFSGSDEFQFTVNDGELTSAPATITITITPVNDAPLAVAASVATPEDTAVAVVLGGTDTENDALTFVITTSPAHGTLSGTAPDLTYTPDADFNGSDSFAFTVSDGALVSAPAAVALSVSAVNDPPQALAQAISVEEDGTLPLTLSGTDTENDALTFTVATPPVHGTLTGTAPDLTYTPDADFHGTDVFSFTVHDGDLTSAPAAVSITVLPVNDVPSATALSAETAEDTAVNFALSGTDIDGDALSAEIVTPPAHGTLSGGSPNYTYTPDANWYGTDSFTFRAGDGLLFSEPAAVTLTVLPVNDRPVALPQASSGVEDTTLAVTLAATDIEGDTLSYTVTVPPAHGTLSGTAPDLTYLPSPDWHGPDSFSFTASDAALTSPPAIVMLTIAPVNDAPAALPAAVQTNEDTAVPITLTGTDIDGDALSYTVVTQPAHGTLSGVLPNAVYTPAADFHGTDEFIFTVNDGSAGGTPAIVSIEVISVNDAPAAQSQAVSTAEDSALIIALGGSDTEDDTLTWSLTGQPAHGSASLDGNEVTYTPDENYNGPDSFVFEVSDGSASRTALVAITVTTVNDAPVTSFDVFSVNEDQTLVVASARRILRNDSDFQEGAPLENNTPLTVVLETPPPHAASFSLAANGTFTYTPKANFQGLDGFTYRAVDALGGISEAETALIAVWAVNDAPVAAPQTLKTLEDVPLAIHLSSGDADNAAVFDPVSLPGISPPNTGPAPHDADPIYAIVTPPQHGTLSGSGSTYAYTPAADFHGTDSFTFTASDGLATSAPATVTITVEPDSDADLLPDAWENLVFATMAFTASDDPDGDGQDNAFELIAGNNPADANSCLCLEAASPSPGGGAFRLNRVQPGVRYSLESSVDLTNWDTVQQTTYELAGPGAIYDPRTATADRRFYRVTVTPE